MTRRLTALCVVAMLAVTGCATNGDSKADKPHKLRAPEAGQCVAKEIKDLDDIAPDFRTVVPCTEPHVFEIVSAFDVPARFLGHATTRAQRLARRTQLFTLAGDDPVRDAFAETSSRRCHAAELRAGHLSNLRLEGKSAEEARVGLVLGGAQSWVNGSPPALWRTGSMRVICSVRFTEHITGSDDVDVDARPVTSKTDRPVWQRFRSSSFPLDRRQCLAYDKDDYGYAATCDKRHYGEYLFSYDANSVFGKTFVKSVDIYDVTDKVWEKLSKPCFDALYTLFGDDFDEGLSSDAEIGEIGWDQTVDKIDLVYCLAVPYDSDAVDLPAGSLFSGAGDVHFVPIVPRSKA